MDLTEQKISRRGSENTQNYTEKDLHVLYHPRGVGADQRGHQDKDQQDHRHDAGDDQQDPFAEITEYEAHPPKQNTPQPTLKVQ